MAGNVDLKIKISSIGGEKLSSDFKKANDSIKELNKETKKTGKDGFDKTTLSVKKLDDELESTSQSAIQLNNNIAKINNSTKKLDIITAGLGKSQSAIAIKTAGAFGRLDSQTKRSVVNVKKLNSEIGKSKDKDAFKKSTEGVKKLGKEANKTNSIVGKTKNLLLGFFGIQAGIGLAKNIFNINVEMEVLRAQLKSLEGSASGGEAAFSFLKGFDTKAPQTIQQLTKAYVSLKNFGLEPTAKVMDAVTNQASKLGNRQGVLEGITRSLGQAYAKGKLQVEEMQELAERGVPIYDLLSKSLGKNTAEILKMSEQGKLGRDVLAQVIEKMGELSSGSNDAQLDTLNGVISKLSTSWTNFADAVLNDKSEGYIKSYVNIVSRDLKKLTTLISDDLDDKITAMENRIKNFDALGAAGGFVGDYSGFDINLLKNQLDGLKKIKQEKKELADATSKEKEATDALVKSKLDANKVTNDAVALAKKLAIETQKTLDKDAIALTNANKTALEKFTDKKELYQKLLAKTTLTQETFNRAMKAAREEFNSSSGQELESGKATLKQIQDRIKALQSENDLKNTFLDKNTKEGQDARIQKEQQLSVLLKNNIISLQTYNDLTSQKDGENADKSSTEDDAKQKAEELKRLLDDGIISLETFTELTKIELPASLDLSKVDESVTELREKVKSAKPIELPKFNDDIVMSNLKTLNEKMQSFLSSNPITQDVVLNQQNQNGNANDINDATLAGGAR